MEDFAVFDCSLARSVIGQSCSNLRELLMVLKSVPDNVLEHHCSAAPGRPFRALRVPQRSGPLVLGCLGRSRHGEQLGLVDPYRLPMRRGPRATLVEISGDRLWDLDRVPWCRPGLELHLLASRVVAYDTGRRISTPAALAEAVERMSLRSLFFHVHEARRRTAGATDDFSLWLDDHEANPALVAGLRAIDFYFLNLSQFRAGIARRLRTTLCCTPPPWPEG